MRKVTASLSSTLDGVVKAPNEWQSALDDEMAAAISRTLQEQDAVPLGRVTCTEWAAYWPTSTDEPFASWINRTPRYVASNTLDSVDDWPNSTLIQGSVADFVTDCASRTAGRSASAVAQRSCGPCSTKASSTSSPCSSAPWSLGVDANGSSPTTPRSPNWN
jgi:hypothetical protein